MFNYSFEEDCPWTHVACRLLPPACLPDALIRGTNATAAFEITCDDEWILKGAVRNGVDLTVPRLRQICLSLKVTLPRAGEGSGKNGSVLKSDIVGVFIRHLWPDADDDFITEVFAKMMKQEKEKVDINVLAMVAELDTDNQESFKRLKDYAMLELESKVFGKGKLAKLDDEKVPQQEKETVLKRGAEKAKKIETAKAAASAKDKEKQWGLTPPALKKLLPGNGDIAGVFWMRWHPTNHFWRVTYPIGISVNGYCNNVFFCRLSEVHLKSSDSIQA